MSATGPTFARLLAAGRGEFNARVAQTRSRVPTFDADAFSVFLRDGVAPLVEAVAARAPEAAAACTIAAFDVALELVARRVVGAGARSALVSRVWSDLLPALATHVAAAPAALIAALSHAALNLDAVPQANSTQWVDRMKRLGPRAASREELLALGQVLAWTVGLSHFRAGALEKLATLAPALACVALGAPTEQSVEAMRARLLADRWWSPDDGIANQARRGFDVGAFTGFGGAFPEPPQVRAAGEDFVVRSGDRYFWLFVDVYGWTLHPATAVEFDQATAEATSRDGPCITTSTVSQVISAPLSHRLRVSPRAAA